MIATISKQTTREQLAVEWVVPLQTWHTCLWRLSPYWWPPYAVPTRLHLMSMNSLQDFFPVFVLIVWTQCQNIMRQKPCFAHRPL